MHVPTSSYLHHLSPIATLARLMMLLPHTAPAWRARLQQPLEAVHSRLLMMLGMIETDVDFEASGPGS